MLQLRSQIFQSTNWVFHCTHLLSELKVKVEKPFLECLLPMERGSLTSFRITTKNWVLELSTVNEIEHWALIEGGKKLHCPRLNWKGWAEECRWWFGGTKKWNPQMVATGKGDIPRREQAFLQWAGSPIYIYFISVRQPLTKTKGKYKSFTRVQFTLECETFPMTNPNLRSDVCIVHRKKHHSQNMNCI